MRWVALVMLLALGGCGSSGPARRDIDALYRFENLRKDETRDEWARIRPILDRASSRPIKVTRSGVRAFGALEMANYEARCVLRSLEDVLRVQEEIESLTGDGERLETTLTSVAAMYKSNFVLATVNVSVSGGMVAGNHVRLFSLAGEAPVETVAGQSGMWSARVPVLPESKWIYGLTADPTGRIPTRYFRISAATRKQERVEEAEFLKMFPQAAPGTAAPVPAPGSVGAAPKPMPPGSPPSAADDEQRLRERREREDEEFRRRRREAERKP